MNDRSVKAEVSMSARREDGMVRMRIHNTGMDLPSLGQHARDRPSRYAYNSPSAMNPSIRTLQPKLILSMSPRIHISITSYQHL